MLCLELHKNHFLMNSFFTSKFRYGLVVWKFHGRTMSNKNNCLRGVHINKELYTVDLFEQELSKLNFPNYQNYNEINEAYNDFIQKITSVIGKVAPIKEAG